MNSSHARYPPREPDQAVAPDTVAAPPKSSSPAAVTGTTPPSMPSPARMLQGHLSAGLSDHPDEKKWPKSGTVLFVVATCGAFWGAVYWAVSALIRK